MTLNDSKLICRDSGYLNRYPRAVIPFVALIFLPACSSQSAFVRDSEPIVARTAHSEISRPGVKQTEHTPVEGQTGRNRGIWNQSSRAGVARTRLDDHFGQNLPVQPAVLTQTSDDGPGMVQIVPLSHKVVSDDQGSSSQFLTSAEPRIDPAFGHMSPADMYPDEYLADGGDRRLPVHYFGGKRQGFDTEDTIAEYSDHSGNSHVRASNRVAVYAPRFGSVRVVEGADSGRQVLHAAGTTEVSAVGSLERQDGIQKSVKEEGVAAAGSWKRADGAEGEQSAIQSRATTRPQRTDKVDQGLQAQSISGMQVLEREQGAGFHRELANAAVWSRDLFPKLSGATSQSAQLRTRLTARATVGIEDQRAKKSEIHIVKLADRDSAESGDFIRFTIRFINTGDYDLHDVRIVDNLTPRLQFIQDSVQTDREGDVITKPNGEGSEILTFDFDEPLPAHQSGTIVFEVRVR